MAISSTNDREVVTSSLARYTKVVLLSDLLAERKWLIRCARVGGAAGVVGESGRDGAEEVSDSESESGRSEFMVVYYYACSADGDDIELGYAACNVPQPKFTTHVGGAFVKYARLHMQQIWGSCGRLNLIVR